MPESDRHGEWREISPTLSVSSNAYVKTFENVHGHRLYKPTTPDSYGYIVFRHAGVRYKMHQLVCRAFHGPPKDASFVPDHINRNRNENEASNLRWATRKDNVANSTPVQRRKLTESTEPQSDLPGEQWKTVGRFQISNCGRARVLRNRNKHPELASSWHPAFTPSTGLGKPYARLGKKLFHQLVAEAFLEEKPCASATVDHIDGNKSNNRVDNLRWASKREQALNRTMQRKAICLSTPVLIWDDIRWLRFQSFAAAARHLSQKHGVQFYHQNVAKTARSNGTYNAVRMRL